MSKLSKSQKLCQNNLNLILVLYCLDCKYEPLVFKPNIETFVYRYINEIFKLIKSDIIGVL